LLLAGVVGVSFLTPSNRKLDKQQSMSAIKMDLGDVKSAVIKYGSVAAPLALYIGATNSAHGAAMAALEGGVAAAIADKFIGGSETKQAAAVAGLLGAYSYLMINKGNTNVAVQVALLSGAGAYIGARWVAPWVSNKFD
jgi:hypothetical protein